MFLVVIYGRISTKKTDKIVIAGVESSISSSIFSVCLSLRDFVSCEAGHETL